MTTSCEEDAALTGPVALFCGIETWNWNLQQFLDMATWAKQHGVSTLFIKVSEVGSTAGDIWYGGFGAWDVIYQELQKIINVIPYSFPYGDQDIQKEISIAVGMLRKYGKFCLDMEGASWSTPDAAGRAKQFADALTPIPGKLWLSCPADPVINNQLPFLQAMSPATNVWMPMIYDDHLAGTWQPDFSQINPQACLQPTLDLSQEFGANNVANIVQQMSNNGIYAISFWYEGFAKQNPGLLDALVQEFTRKPTIGGSMKWYDYPICVPFGDPNYDSEIGGSHDMDVQTPPNTPVTALEAGTVRSVTRPSWGISIGIELDQRYNGVPYMGYLHLAAVNVAEGQHVNAGDVIAWSGGCNTRSQYGNTTNPKGEYFLNDSSSSSQPQTGIALMYGPVYGEGAGWFTIPPVKWELDPTPLILNARKATMMAGVPTGWHDDGTTLTAPNGHKVVRGFRAKVMAGWDAADVPLEEERQVAHVEQYYPSDAGAIQTFNFSRLCYTQARGVYKMGIGNELLGCEKALAQAQAKAVQPPPVPTSTSQAVVDDITKLVAGFEQLKKDAGVV